MKRREIITSSFVFIKNNIIYFIFIFRRKNKNETYLILFLLDSLVFIQILRNELIIEMNYLYS